jgi:hypothetical protein
MPRTRKLDPIKHCEICGMEMTRKRYNGRLEDRGVFLRRRRCSQACANSRQEVKKDTAHWRARQHRKPMCEMCEMCGTATDLHVHHVDRDPWNNDPANLRTLCSSCHLTLHWREDREKRLAALRGSEAVAAAWRGASMRPRSTAGRFVSGA